MTMRRALLLVVLCGLIGGCTQAEPSLASPQAPSPVAAPPDEARSAAASPGLEPAWTPPHWEGEYAAMLQPGACVDASAFCRASGMRISTPIFDLDVNRSDPRVANATHYVFVAEWTATTDAARVVRFQLRSDEGRVELGKGASPFRLEIPARELEFGEAYAVQAYPDVPGAFVDQVIRVRLDLA